MKKNINKRIGVYTCHCGSNIAGKVDVSAVAEYASGLDNVVVSREYKFMCSEPGQRLIVNDIKEHDLSGVVVAACSPLMHEKTFKSVLQSVGLNPYLMQMANIREHCSWVTEDSEKATTKAKALVSGAVGKARYLEPLKQSNVSITKSVLVVGGGIAGIQAALQCANSGFKVYLVEKEQSIGGHMAMLDKTFPTLDCSACILTPKMVSVGQHPNIELRTYCEVEKVSGYIGNLNIAIRHKAKYVDHDKCNGCGLCQEKCPGKADNMFEQNRDKRKAIYTLFAQAVPNKPVIDFESCIYMTKGKCGTCKKICPKEAIDFEQKDTIEEITVGAIIVATGFELYDGSHMLNYGYGKFPNVISSLEFERMVNSSGFTKGEIVTTEGKHPRTVGIIHCVGSRDQRNLSYCSQVCCMYSLKFAHLINDHVGATVYNFYIDMRCVGKGYEEFYDRLLNEGVRFIRGKVAEVAYNQDDAKDEGKLVVKVEDSLMGKVREIPLDMVILANGLAARSDSKQMARKLGISINKDGFFIENHPKLNPIGTQDQCVYIAGTCAGPKDIPHTVVQASAAAAGAIEMLSKDTIPLDPITANVKADLCMGCKICNTVCPYEAVKFDKEKGCSIVNDSLCRGCGTCVAACPAGAIEGNHFTDVQIMSEIESLIMI
ncbi:MAG: CoB--CoM heterodisulfide reductase iron-sulfur subunit A family protein [Bacteroidota bacterium]